MLNYIAMDNTAKIIQKICKSQNMLILYKEQKRIDIKRFLKETKVNFNLVKQFIIEINCVQNSEEEIIESIINFRKLYCNTRIIILAQGMDSQSKLLTQLYDVGIYNLINETDEIERKLIKALSDTGIQKKEAEKFKRIYEVNERKISRSRKIKNQIVYNIGRIKKSIKDFDLHQYKGVYFFIVILKIFIKLTKAIGYIVIFLILLNSELRNKIFQLLGLK